MVKELLIELGYDNNSIDKIISWHQNSLEETLYNYIVNIFEYFKLKGYSKRDIIKMTKHIPLLFSYSKKNIDDKFKHLKSKGYSEKEIIKMTKQLPSLLCYSEENIEGKFNYLKSKGYNNQEIINATKYFPAILSYSKENIEDKFNYLKDKGYNEKEIIKMTKQLPSLFGLCNENIDKKIEFYREIGLEDIILYDTMKLMQSVELTYARYRFLSDLGIIITMENYNVLFYKQKDFNNKYKITNDELINRNPYNQKIKVIK